MQDLNVTLIQSELYWQNIDANLAMFEEKIWEIGQSTDLIILPEMFNTGFSMEVQKLAEPMNSKTFRWMKQQAAQTQAVVTGSFIVREGNRYYNRLIWMEADGTYAYYDKRHLFRMAGEEKVYSAGNKQLICELKGWKICPMICYDLRFPVWSRNRQMGDESLQYDLLLFIANWPAARIEAWNTLLQARAIENLSYVAGVNRTGQDGKNIDYNGCSALVDPKGQLIYKEENQEAVQTLTLAYEPLSRFRQKFPAHLDADRFRLHADD